MDDVAREPVEMCKSGAHPRDPRGRILVGDMSMDYGIVKGIGSWPADFRITVHVDPRIEDQFLTVLSAFESPIIVDVTLDVDIYFLSEKDINSYQIYQEKAMRYALDDLAKANDRVIVSVSPLETAPGKTMHTRTWRMRALTVPTLPWVEWSR